MPQHAARRPLGLAVAVGAAAALALAGCSGSGTSSGGSSAASAASAAASASTSAAPEAPAVGDLYQQVRMAALAAKSASVKGTVTEDGEQLTLEITGRADGSNQKLVLAPGAGKGTATILTVDKTLYIKGDEEFWTASGAKGMAKALAAKYVAESVTKASDLARISVGGMLEQMFNAEALTAFEGLTTKVEQAQLGGVPAWVLKGRVSDDGEVWVKASDRSLLKIVGPASSPGELVFSDWDAAPVVKAPAAKDVLAQ